MTDNVKRIGVKFAGTNRPTETKSIAPGTLTRDLLRDLSLDPTSFQITNARGDATFALDDVIFARVEDGDLVYAAARVEAGV